MAQESFDLSGLLQSLQGEDLSALLETAGALFGAGAADPAPKDAPSKASPQEEAAVEAGTSAVTAAGTFDSTVTARAPLI